LRSDHQLGQTEFAEHVAELEKLPLFSSNKPSLDSDKLFKANYEHAGDYYSECRECLLDELVRRPSHAEKRPGGTFNFHLGTIGSGGSVIQDGVKRDLESRRCNYARCFEMEAVGVNISSRCLVIRGIADYADSHKNDLWKYKAAGNAAVFAKELLLKMNPGIPEELSKICSNRS
jgi:nucleoside phosphorylase